jgi:hypothetical protein
MNLLWCSDFEREIEELRNESGVIWVFQHVPKTAGSSLLEEIHQRMPRPGFFNVYVTADLLERRDLKYGEAFQVSFQRFMHQDISKYMFVTGHFSRPNIIAMSNNPKARFFTILRDPLSRAISDYRYQQTPKHPPHKTFIKNYPTFDSYINDPGYRNTMSNYIAGVNSTFEECQAIVMSTSSFCGVFERYDETLDVIGRLMNLRGARMGIMENNEEGAGSQRG